MRSLFFTLVLALCVPFSVPGSAFAHAKEDHAAAPGEAVAGSASGPIEVSEIAQRNLGLTVDEADLRPVETTLRVIGEIQADPERSGTVSSRIPGRVSAVYAREGEKVAKGERIVEVESLLLGDPPPRVRYASPVSGVVTDRHVVVGDDVEPSRHLFEVADLDEVLAIGRIFEGQIQEVSVGQKARVRVPSYPDEIFDGVVERLGGSLDQESRSLAVYVRVANADGRLRPHMRATLSLITGGAEFALAIPKKAVLGEAGQIYVFVQDEDRPVRFERRALVLGVSNDRFVEVVEGLYPGELVVTEGSYSLQYLTPVEEDETDRVAGGVVGEGGESEGERHAEADGDTHSHAEGEGHAGPEGSNRPSAVWAVWILGALSLAVLAGRMLRGRSRRAPEAR